MKPIKLILNAFGPFSSKQEIDFTILENDNLFLITGPTGSGKTTIFDAITFALYGVASGSLKKSDELKSQYASITEKCYVSFIFEIKGEEYYIYRSPIQEKLKRDKTVTIEKSCVELRLPNGTIITQSNAVSEKIFEITGLTKDQFKKIVMLPQGEFRKLLEEDNDKKQKIFRNIFGTQVLDIFASALKDKVIKLRQKLSAVYSENKANYKLIDTSEAPECLEKLISSDIPDASKITNILKELNEKDKKALFEFNEKLRSLTNEKESINIQYAQYINSQFDEQQKNNDILGKLKDKSGLIKALELKVKDIKAYITYSDKLKLLSDYNKEIEIYSRRISDEKIKAQKIETEIACLKPKYENINNQKKQINSLQKKLMQYKNCLEVFDEIYQSEKAAENIKSQITKAELSIENADKFIERKKLYDEYGSLEDTINLLKELLKNIYEYKDILKQLQDAENKYNYKFQAYLNHNKSIIAQSLKPNQPCPVCGSLKHPAPFFEETESISESDVDIAKNKYDFERKKITEFGEKIKTILEKLSESKTADLTFDNVFINIEYINTIISEKELQQSNINNNILNCESQLKLTSHANLSDKRYLDYNFLIANREKVISSLESYKEELLKQLKITDKLKEKLPEKDFTVNLCNEKISNLQNQISELEKTAEEITQKYLDTTSNLSLVLKSAEIYSKSLEQRKKNVNDIKNDINKYNNLVNDNLISSLKGEVDSLEEYENQITEYYNELAVTENNKASLEKALKGKVRYDVLKLKTKLEELNSQIISLNSSILNISAKLKKNQLAEKNISQNIEKVHALDKDYRTLSYLSKLTEGDNPHKISFERYVLASYFEEIIQAANIRLAHMTDDRYKLHRKTQKGKNGKGSGLDLEVFDSNTGKFRDVSTLSGGESFKASLSLALGLSDIVSNYSGGIQIDTLFIDEGFGTLDEESLNTAIECLMQLNQSGRIIGIISHVPELKERINAKLVLTSGQNGSKAEFVFSR